MNEALVAAQQLREETRAAAAREAHMIVREAEAEARRLLEEARVTEQDVRTQTTEAERQFRGYLAGFRALLDRQLAELRARSEEHTSELQSQSNLVCRLLLEKKNKEV